VREKKERKRKYRASHSPQKASKCKKGMYPLKRAKVELDFCNIPDVTVTKIRIMASSTLHSIVVKHTLMHQLKMSLIWLNVLRELKCVYLVH